MLTRLMAMIRWLAGLARVTPEELKQAGGHLGRLRD